MLFRCRLYTILITCCFALSAKAQDSLLIHRLLQRIALQQSSNKNGFLKDNFTSYVSNHSFFSEKKRDDNIFFTALINYTLTQQYFSLSPTETKLVDSINQTSLNLYPHFQNRNKRLTYNFWRTDTAFVFPYTWWIHVLKKTTALPDDMDDTVLALLAQDADSAMAVAAHQVMQEYISEGNKSQAIERKFRSYHTYSVWYGNHFPPVLDVCVLSNILSFVQHYHLSWTSADSAALDVIVESVSSNDYINKQLYVSPYYGNTSLILYHLSRLMSYDKIPQLEAVKTKLLVTALQEFASTNDLLQKVMLASAIMKWGYTPPAISLSDNNVVLNQIEASNLPFFVGNIPSYFPLFYKHIFIQQKWLLFYHYCPAFNDALLVEYLLLKKAMTQIHKD